jgi:hypothetical protein
MEIKPRICKKLNPEFRILRRPEYPEYSTKIDEQIVSRIINQNRRTNCTQNIQPKSTNYLHRKQSTKKIDLSTQKSTKSTN